MPKLILTALLLSICTSLRAASDIDHYAYQAAIGESESNLQRVELPLEIMLATTSPSLGDVAVFNVNGKSLPHTVMKIPDRFEEQVIDLPFHRFDRFIEQRNKTVTRREQNQQENSIAETTTTESVAVQSVRSDYLIELQPDGASRKFEAIELDWRHEPASQILGVRVEVGNEIDRLRSIRPRKSLTNSQPSDPDLRSIRRIPARNRYLRLVPLDDVELFEIEKVTGRYRHKLPAPMLTHELVSEFVVDDGGEYYYFRYPSAHTAETMRLIPADGQSVLTGDLYYSRRAEPETRILAERGYRQHNLEGDEIKPNRPFNMTRLYAHSIWFTTDSRQSAPPRVELTYPQYEVIFIADGNGPYRLAWGNLRNPAPPVNLGKMLAVNLHDPNQRGTLVGLGSIDEAGGAERLRPQTAWPWKKWLLWALLGLAAIVTGRMALKLYHEMNQPQA